MKGARTSRDVGCPGAKAEEPGRGAPAVFLGWLALGMAGQAAFLVAVDAGKKLHFQHARPLSHAWILAFVALGAAIVAAGVRHARLEWPWGGIRLFAVLAGMAATAATVSRAPGEWVVETVFNLAVQLAALGAFVLAARAAPERLVAAVGRGVTGAGGRIPLAAALLTVAAAAALSVGVYERQPHVQDEVAYLHQARMFAAGRVSMPAPPVPQAFEYFLLDVDRDHAAAAVPPGFAALLAPVVRSNLAWLVNPLFGGLNVWLLYLVLRRFYAPPVPALGSLLLAASPWHLFLAMSFMNHTTVLTAVLLAVLGLMRGSAVGAAGAGVALGWISLSRPLDFMVFAALLCAWVVRRRKLWPALLSAGAVAALVLPYNQAVTGNAFSFPLSRYMDRIFGPGRNSIGFGANRGLPWPLDPFPGHGPADVVVNTQMNASGLNAELFGWASGSLVFLLALAVTRTWNVVDRWMAAFAAATVAMYSLYWFNGGPDFGPRYWFPMLAPCAVLTARGVVAMRARFGDRVLVLAALLASSAWATFVPWRAADKYRGYLGMTSALRELAERERFGRSLVVVRGPEFPDYAAVAWLNEADWGGDGPVYARETGPEITQKLRAAYPDRALWVVEGPSLTGNGYRVVHRPGFVKGAE